MQTTGQQQQTGTYTNPTGVAVKITCTKGIGVCPKKCIGPNGHCPSADIKVN